MAETLSELLAYAHKLEQKIVDQAGEMSEADDNALVALESHLTTKTDSIAFVLDHFENRAEYWNERAEKLKRIAAQLKRQRQRIREAVKLAMVTNGYTEIKGRDMRMTLAKSLPSLVVEDEKKVPNTYQICEFRLDKESLKKDLMAGKYVVGAYLEEGLSLRITDNRGEK